MTKRAPEVLACEAPSALQLARKPALSDLLQRQRSAFLSDGPPSLTQRRATLASLRTLVLEFRTRIEGAVSADFGHRSRHETALLEVLGVVQAIDYLSNNLRRFMAPQKRHVATTYRGGSARVEYQPLGVVGVVAPWNYPFSLLMIPLATALAAGNRVMLKQSELTPRTGELIEEMMRSLFLPTEVEVVRGGPDVGAEFCGLQFDHLLFTGSTQVGRKVMAAASEHLVPVTLELGGKCPVLVARGHAKALAVERIVFGKLTNAGQTCVAPDYAFVHESEVDAFVELYDQAVRRFYPDGPTGQDYTSIISDHHYRRICGLIEDARSKGARVLEVGVQPGAASTRLRTVAPTLIVDAGEDALAMQEEIFGPVLPVRSYKSLAEVVDYINGRPRPLALYYFGAEDRDCEQVRRRTTSGNLTVNGTMVHVAIDDLPFGGVGESGMGAYHGIEGFRAMSHAKGVFVQSRWSLPSLLRAPFGWLAERTIASTLRGRGASRPRLSV